MADVDNPTTSIAAAASLSGQVDIGSKVLVGLFLPANWTPASITFQVSFDGGTTWAVLMDPVTAGPYTVATVTPVNSLPAAVAIDPTKLRGYPSLKVQSGTPTSPVPQTNAVTITLSIRMVI